MLCFFNLIDLSFNLKIIIKIILYLFYGFFIKIIVKLIYLLYFVEYVELIVFIRVNLLNKMIIMNFGNFIILYCLYSECVV